jgi:hypothetical protein
MLPAKTGARLMIKKKAEVKRVSREKFQKTKQKIKGTIQNE